MRYRHVVRPAHAASDFAIARSYLAGRVINLVQIF
jgi:hypothetical protein